MTDFEIDPNSINMTFDFDVKGFLENSIRIAEAAAIKTNKPYILFYEEVNGEPNYKVESKSWAQYKALEFTCPQDADLAFRDQFDSKRPLPSAVILPPNKIVVSKPDLCDNCIHRLTRGLGNNCMGLVYEPLLILR